MNEDSIIYLPTQVPVFPLPQVVLFPGALIPLHLFEPRYREMAADAIASSGVIALALLKPGYEPLYYTHRAPIHRVAGLGQIISSEKLDTGNYNVLVRGIARARVLDESVERSYRLARIEPLQTYSSAGDKRAADLFAELKTAIRAGAPLDAQLRERWLQLFEVALDLDALSDLLAAGLPASAELRQCLLDEIDAATRTEMLIDQLKTLTSVARNRRRTGTGDEHSMN